MRRLRETGIMTMLLLALTGCAGLEQRLGWTEPPYVGDEGSEERPLSRLAFWRRHRAEEAAPATSAPGSADPARSTMIAGSGTSSATAAADDEERPGLLRRLPLVGRLWKAGDRDDSDAIDVPLSRYTLSPAATAFAPPRAPANTTAFVPPRAPAAAGAAAPADDTKAVAAPAPAAAAAPTAETAANPPQPAGFGDEPLRELTADLGRSRPQVDSAAIPARTVDAPALPDSPAAGAAADESAPPDPGATGPQARREAAAPPSAAPGPPPPEATPDLSSVPGTSREPSAPSPTVETQPASGSPPASGSSTSTLASTPGPAWPAAWGSGQAMVVTSSQAGYVAGGCEAPCGPNCKKHKICPFRKHKQQMVPSSVVLPSAQGIVSSCEATAPCKVKKPCFLKTWLHHKSGCKNKGCKGCKKCTYCGEPAMMVSAQGPMVSPQY